jgi:hypothetical protein
MANQKNRRIGMGMSLRKSATTTGELEIPAVLAKESVSLTEGHEEVAKEAVEEGVIGEPQGGNLESVFPGNGETKTVEAAAPGENEPIVAQSDDFDRLPEPTEAGEDLLAEMLKKSEVATGAGPQFTVKPIPGREFSNFGGPTEEQLARSVYEEGKTDPRDFAGIETTRMITFEEAAQMGLPPVEGADGYVIYRDGHGEMWKSDGKSVSRIGEILDLKPLGELPNGEYRATVRIAEWCVEGVKGQAEADGISVEDWLTLRLTEYLEQWWAAPAAR